MSVRTKPYLTSNKLLRNKGNNTFYNFDSPGSVPSVGLAFPTLIDSVFPTSLREK